MYTKKRVNKGVPFRKTMFINGAFGATIMFTI